MDAVIPCVCPGRPHDTDTVTFRDRLDFRRAAAIKGDVVVMKLDNPDSTPGEMLAVLSEGYIRQGVESWSLVGTDRKPLPVNQTNIGAYLIDVDLDVAMQLADVADDLYAESVMRPLLRSASPSSPGTPTEPSTSPDPSPSATELTSTSPTSPPQPSKRSSTSSTPTVGIAPTTSSRAGGSSYSPSSPSAP